MKDRASFTLDKETLDILDKLSEKSKYRNKSHIVEEAIKLLGKTEDLEDKKEEKDE